MLQQHPVADGGGGGGGGAAFLHLPPTQSAKCELHIVALLLQPVQSLHVVDVCVVVNFKVAPVGNMFDAVIVSCPDFERPIVAVALVGGVVVDGCAVNVTAYGMDGKMVIATLVGWFGITLGLPVTSERGPSPSLILYSSSCSAVAAAIFVCTVSVNDGGASAPVLKYSAPKASSNDPPPPDAEPPSMHVHVPLESLQYDRCPASHGVQPHPFFLSQYAIEFLAHGDLRWHVAAFLHVSVFGGSGFLCGGRGFGFGGGGRECGAGRPPPPPPCEAPYTLPLASPPADCWLPILHTLRCAV